MSRLFSTLSRIIRSRPLGRPAPSGPGLANGENLRQVWIQLRQEAAVVMVREPALIGVMQKDLISQPNLGTAVARRLAGRLALPELPANSLASIFEGLLHRHPGLARSWALDLQAVIDRDPACHGLLEPFLHFKGFQALAASRLAHRLWMDERRALALWVQGRVAELWAVDIHPAARLGDGILVDHATGLVIGETAVVGDNVNLLHEVTLGGRGTQAGALRHPQVEDGVSIGAGAKILGPIRVGQGARIGAGSVVLHPVRPGQTVVGVPAHPTRGKDKENAS